MKVSNMMVCCSQYIQAKNACDCLGDILTQLCVSRIYLLCSGHAESELETIADRLRQAKIEFHIGLFSGYSCLKNAQVHADAAIKNECTFVVGIGGGKCMDTTKMVSKLARIPMGMIPTQLATCASCAVVAVEYDENGAYVGPFFPDHPASFVIADLTLLSKAPARFIAAGVLDSMAKYPELHFTHRDEIKCDKINDAAMQVAFEMSRRSWELLLSNARTAFSDNCAQRITPSFSSVTDTNLIITGAISGLARGSKQLAVAHAFYNASTVLFPEQWRTYLHGEIVSVGLALQMSLNAESEVKRKQLSNLARDLGVPTTLGQIGIERNECVLDRIYQTILSTFNTFGEIERKRLREGLESIA